MAFPTGYSLYDEVTIDNTKVSGTANHSNFPVYIDLSDMSAQFWSNVSNGGGDIRVTLDDGTTQLAREVVSCDTSGQTGELHVNIPTLYYNQDTVIRIWYNGTDTEPAADSTYGSQNTWNSDYLSVLHFEEISGTFYDSTSNAENASDNVSDTGKDGKIGKGQEFDGINDYAEFSIQNLTSGGITVQSWNKYLGAGSHDSARLVLLQNNNDFFLGVTTSLSEWRAYIYDGSNGHSITTPMVTDTWTQLTGTWDGSTLSFYKNGSFVGDTPVSAMRNAGRRDTIGGEPQFSNNYFNGNIDEVRILSTALSSNWISTEYNNQSSPSTFYSVVAKGAAQAFTVTLSEVISASDTTLKSTIFSKILSGQLTLSDVVSGVRALFITLSDNIGLTGVLQKTTSYFKTIFESISTIGSVMTDITGKFFVTLSETLNLQEKQERLTKFVKTITESISISDIITAVKSFFLQLAEVIGLNTTTYNSSIYTYNDDISYDGEFENIQSGIGIVRSEQITTSDIIQKLTSFKKTLSEFISLSGVIGSLKKALLTLSESINLTGALDRVANMSKTFTESIATSDVVKRIALLKKTLSETVSLSGITTAGKQLFKTLSETINLTGITNRLSIYGKVLSEKLSISDTFVHKGWSWIKKNVNVSWSFRNKGKDNSGWTFRDKNERTE